MSYAGNTDFNLHLHAYRPQRLYLLRQKVMRFFINILLLAVFAIVVNSCGSASALTNTNEVYEGAGEGFANEKDFAWNIAYAKACAKIASKYNADVVSNENISYSQNTAGAHGRDSSSASVQIRVLSTGRLYDVVVTSEKLLSWWKCRRRGYLYGYAIKVRIDPSNIN